MVCSVAATASLLPSPPPKPTALAADDHHARLRAAAARSDLPAALAAFVAMSSAGAPPVLRTFTSLLKLCAARGDLATGRAVHAQLAARGLDSEALAATALANMYAKCRRPADARRVFDRMPVRDRVAWNALVAGYARNGLARMAMEMVVRMQEEEGERPDSITLVSVLPACANARALAACREAHAFAIRSGLEELVNVATAILDAYCKCGDIRAARVNGDSREALALFNRMVEEGVDVTDVSVLAALQACGELGCLDEGTRVHELLVRIGLDSNVSVMNALITMYSKCKRVDLASHVFDELDRRTQVSWNAMILGCAQNGCSEDAVRLFTRMQLENVKPDSFTLVSVIPALADISDPLQARWIHGYSISTNHQQAKEIYSRLAKLIEEIKAVGYVPDTDSIHDVEDDVKAQLLNTHSEKLAIAFGLIRTAPGTTIQIKKNLRVCNDCHNATKLISLVTGREIIMRDIQRFHHFKDGKCSCGDYW
ncbi:hypothetical protein OsI_21347 [Oryza sativa Indica Group]|uniref:DYW domain-containing protein n=1 Tax=Oryza sativa subsp. indica TaxID=39946 RepID=A2Y8G9_ORYSI|nr:hypothetical protein OsI_21347 [Oryza sativa Indica Group]